MSPVPAPALLDWQCLRLADFDPLALHRVLRARQEVFVVEQACAYLDADAADECSWHLAAWAPGRQLMAYARLVDPGVKYPEASIGRVITTASARGTGLGRTLLRRALAECERAWPGQALRISAQSHLVGYYAEVGFVPVGEPYLEDAIPHTEMLRPPPHLDASPCDRALLP
jgi:ElaA protein